MTSNLKCRLVFGELSIRFDHNSHFLLDTRTKVLNVWLVKLVPQETDAALKLLQSPRVPPLPKKNSQTIQLITNKCLPWSWRFKSPKQFSIGLRSALLAERSTCSTRFAASKAVVCFDQCTLDLSCNNFILLFFKSHILAETLAVESEFIIWLGFKNLMNL